MLKIVITGSKGRMGSRLAQMVGETKDLELIAGIDKGDSLKDIISKSDVVVDFSVAEAASDHATTTARHAKPIVIGTTGLSNLQINTIKEASLYCPVILAANMSIGINILYKLVEIAAHATGRRFAVDIVETHHAHKLDRPSGTAKNILDIVLKETGRSLDKDVFFHNEERTSPSEETSVSVRSIRRGEVVGDHAVHFTSMGETLSILHHAATRDIFAQGAIAAVRWIVGKPAGLYGMGDVLGF